MDLPHHSEARASSAIETWLNDSWSYTGNTGVWAQMSASTKQPTRLYLPVELPTGDYYGGHRPGNGLFGESIVALDLKTGVRKWHYQLVHHGIWDMDIPCAPILTDITVNGQTVPALAQPTKQAFLYVFDRVTGTAHLADGRTPGAAGRRARRMVFAHAAVSNQAARLRSPGRFAGRSDRLHAGAACTGAGAGLEIQNRTDLHSARRQQGGRSAGCDHSPWHRSAARTGRAGPFDPETHILYVFSQTATAELGLVPPAAGART